MDLSLLMQSSYSCAINMAHKRIKQEVGLHPNLESVNMNQEQTLEHPEVSLKGLDLLKLKPEVKQETEFLVKEERLLPGDDMLPFSSLQEPQCLVIQGGEILVKQELNLGPLPSFPEPQDFIIPEEERNVKRELDVLPPANLPEPDWFKQEVEFHVKLEPPEPESYLPEGDELASAKQFQVGEGSSFPLNAAAWEVTLSTPNIISDRVKSVGATEQRKDQSDRSTNKTVCGVCLLRFPDEQALASHRVAFHREEIEIVVFPCGICEEVFPLVSSLDEHKTTHHSKEKHYFYYDCDKCKAWFTCNAQLEAHNRNRHPGEKSVVRENYQTKFVLYWPSAPTTAPESVTKTAPKPVRKIAPKVAPKTPAILRRSLRTKESKKQKPYVCTVCQAQFKLQHELTSHMALHTNCKRTFVCNICQARFRKRHQYHLHRKRSLLCRAANKR